MKTNFLITLAGAALAVPLLATSLGQSGKVSVGDTPEYTFRETPTNAMGVKSLKDLRGKPTLVEFWGTK